MALSRDVVIRLLGDASSAEKAIKSAADAAEVSVSAYRRAEREAAKQAAAQKRATEEMHAAYTKLGRGMVTFGAITAVGLGLAAKAAIDWEQAWAGVTKVTDGSPQQMAELESELRNLATTLPATHEEIAGVAEAAGQLGVKRQDIAEFTKVAIAMGVSTNLAAEEAATGMARFSNIMGTSFSDVDRLGSAIVALGNDGASTEGEILDMGLRIAAAGRQANMTEGDVLGIANALSSLGMEAEAGGTAVSTVIKKINSSVSSGGDALEQYAQIAGMSAQQFAAAWRDDAAQALVLVVRGLGQMQASGADVNGVLGDLGLSGIRTSDALLRMSSNSQLLADSLKTGNKAWADNNALMNEANKRYETTASQIAIARNQINDAAIDIGGMLLPALAKGAEMVANFARGFQELPGWAKTAVTVLGGLAATVGLVGGAALIAVPKIVAFRTTMQTLAASSAGMAAGVGRFGLMMTGPVGAAIGIGVTLLGGLVTALGASSRASEEAAQYQRDLASALRESGGAIDANVRALAAKNAVETKSDGKSLLEWAEDLGVALPRVTDMLLGNRDAYDELSGAIERRIAALQEEGTHLNQGSGQEAGRIATQIDAYRDLQGVIDEQANAMGGAVVENQRLAEAEKTTAEAAGGATTTMSDLRDVTEQGAGATGNMASAAEDLIDALDELNGVNLDLRGTQRAFQAALDDAAASLKENGHNLDINTEKGRANAEALDKIAETAARQAEAVLNSTGSYDAFRSSLEASREALIKSAMDMGMTREQAQALADQILQIPDAASVDVTMPTYGQVTDQLRDVYSKVKGLPPNTPVKVSALTAEAESLLKGLGFTVTHMPDGTTVVTANTDPARDALNNLINTRWTTTVTANMIVNGISRPGVPSLNAQGGRVGRYAPGGGPDLGELAIVGERGPELVRFGGAGYVTPADLTAHALTQARDMLTQFRPAPWASWAAGRADGGGSGGTHYSRTWAPHIEVTNYGRPLSAGDIARRAYDEEWLRTGGRF